MMLGVNINKNLFLVPLVFKRLIHILFTEFRNYAVLCHCLCVINICSIQFGKQTLFLVPGYFRGIELKVCIFPFFITHINCYI